MKLRIPPASIFLFLASVTFGQQDTWVRVSPRDPRYLELSSGAPYVPNGLNLIAPPRAGTPEESMRVFQDWLDALAANKGNYVRFWMSNPFWDTEADQSGVYDETKAQRLAHALDLCRSRGIRVKLTLEHFRSIGGGPQLGRTSRCIAYKLAVQPPQSQIFFEGEASRQRFRQKIAWMKKIFGDRPEVYGWELWNEINAVRGGDYLAWTAAMLPELHKAFPKNLAMQSLGSFDTPRVTDVYRKHSLLPGNDLAQVHRYLDLGASLEVCKGPLMLWLPTLFEKFFRITRSGRSYWRNPVRWNPNTLDPFGFYATDKQGIILHDVLFAPIVCRGGRSGADLALGFLCGRKQSLVALRAVCRSH